VEAAGEVPDLCPLARTLGKPFTHIKLHNPKEPLLRFAEIFRAMPTPPFLVAFNLSRTGCSLLNAESLPSVRPQKASSPVPT
jgi:hypothetical protein